MHWLLTTHVRRYNKQHHASGHVYQGRFKAFAIEQDDHLLTVLRYVERNPLRANLVGQAEAWLWSSLRWRTEPTLLPFLEPSPISLGNCWTAEVNAPQTESELARLRVSVNRASPFGSPAWTAATAHRLDLEPSLEDSGRPRKPERRPRSRTDGPGLFA
jgi:putative transposase